MYGINCFDTFENVLDGIVHRILTGFYCKAFVSHVLKSDNFVADLLLSELYSCDMLVFHVIRTVNTAVYTVIRKVQGSKHYYAVSVKGKLYFVCKLVHLLNFFRNGTGEKDCRLAVRKACAGYTASAFFRSGFGEQLIDKLNVVFVCFRICDCFDDFFIVYEFIGLHRFGVIDCHFYFPF